MLSGIDESQDFRDGGIRTRQMPHLVQTLGKDAGPVKQLLIKRSYHREALAGELAAFHADDVEADEACELAVRKAKRDHVAAHPGEPAHHHLRAHPAELMHRRQAADENKIADLGVATQRRRGGKSHVIPHDAVVTDVAAIHEITAIPNPGNAATGHRPGVHGHLFPEGAAPADLKTGHLAAIAMGLRRRAQRNEWVDGAAVTDGGLRRDVHMRDQLAIRADHDMGPDDAVGTDRGALADHSAILDPRGGIDRTHRVVRYHLWGWVRMCLIFQWLARVTDAVQ